ncbi:mitochondrial carrier domain-containing protein [Lipomyces japonicus]|uniref:mitochondrial carrier domain-containing protein n=1 Tax=Lipomyces japonicus TaxID=56871 RepID=UPI0034CDF829
MEESEPQLIEAVERNELDSSLRVLKDITAGTCGGIAQVLVGQPFDTAKVRLQSAAPGTYSGALDVAKKLIANEGPLAFYKGTLTPLVGVGACVSMQFGVFEGTKRYFARQNKKNGLAPDLSYGQFYLAGSIAGIANTLLATPIEHVRIRLQTQTSTTPPQFKGPVDVIKQLTKHNGIAGVFRGFTPTLIREAHGLGIYFLAYEYLVKRDAKANSITRTEIPGWRLCIYGGGAGYAMWLTSYPIDVVKSRMQTDAIDRAGRTFANTIDCTKQTFRSFGIKGFFRGFVPTMLRAAPVNASTFYAFELAMRAMG